RQLTTFDEGQPSAAGCTGWLPPPLGCFISVVGHDPDSDTVLFASNCDPFGTNAWGDQIFAMQFDGSDKRQLTQLDGFKTEADGTITVEFSGFAAYSETLLR